MKRWQVLGLPLFIALLTTPMPVWAIDVDDSLNDNNVAVDSSAIIEDNLNGPIGNDTQNADNAANDQSIAFDEINLQDIANDKSTTSNANGNVAIDDITVEDVANDKSVYGNDTLSATNAANENSFIISDVQVAVASSVLGGQVTGNTITAQPFTDMDIQTGSNCLADGTLTMTGISVVSQDTGIMTQTQQSVNVQANLTK